MSPAFIVIESKIFRLKVAADLKSKHGKYNLSRNLIKSQRMRPEDLAIRQIKSGLATSPLGVFLPIPESFADASFCLLDGVSLGYVILRLLWKAF